MPYPLRNSRSHCGRSPQRRSQTRKSRPLLSISRPSSLETIWPHLPRTGCTSTVAYVKYASRNGSSVEEVGRGRGWRVGEAEENRKNLLGMNLNMELIPEETDWIIHLFNFSKIMRFTWFFIFYIFFYFRQFYSVPFRPVSFFRSVPSVPFHSIPFHSILFFSIL
jgi:hypothetical protein